jgi:hypothetical protein
MNKIEVVKVDDHKEKSWVFPLPKSTMFLVKWDKVQEYVTYMVLI